MVRQDRRRRAHAKDESRFCTPLPRHSRKCHGAHTSRGSVRKRKKCTLSWCGAVATGPRVWAGITSSHCHGSDSRTVNTLRDSHIPQFCLSLLSRLRDGPTASCWCGHAPPSHPPDHAFAVRREPLTALPTSSLLIGPDVCREACAKDQPMPPTPSSVSQPQCSGRRSTRSAGCRRGNGCHAARASLLRK